jgi:hypothetical protein
LCRAREGSLRHRGGRVSRLTVAPLHRRHRAEFKEEYWDGNSKVERKLEKNGEYKEERKCKGEPRAACGLLHLWH